MTKEYIYTCHLCGKRTKEKKCYECENDDPELFTNNEAMTTKEITARLQKIINSIDHDSYTIDNITRLIRDINK